jgi:hypothetical protein
LVPAQFIKTAGKQRYITIQILQTWQVRAANTNRIPMSTILIRMFGNCITWTRITTKGSTWWINTPIN